MYKNLSIRSKIIVSVLGINIAVFIALFFIYYNFSSSVVEKETTEKAYSRMNESIAELESFLTEKEKVAWTVSELPLVKQWLAENEIRYVDKDNDPEFSSIAQLFRELEEKDKQINSVFVSSEKTDMYYGTDPYPVDTTYKVTKRPWYIRAKEIGKPSFDISEDFSTKLIMVNSRIPIYDEGGRLLGIGGCDINLKSFMKFVAELKIFETGKIYLLNNEGTYIFNPDSSKILSSKISDMKPESVDEEDFNITVGKIVGGETGFTEIQDDVDKYLFYTPIKSVNWTFVLTVDKDEINAPLSSLAEISIIIIFVSVLVLGAAIFFTAGSVSKPIHNLTSGIMKAAKSGDLSFNAVVASNDDVGQLAESFNFLMNNLKLKADAAKEIANGNLAVNVEVISDMDLLGKSMLTMKESIKNVVDEINGFSDAALNGKLDWRADPTPYYGDYQKILLGINRTIDAILGPVNEASETLRRLANRDLRVRMSGDYRGDHARLKNTLNTAIQNLEDALTQVSHSIESNTSAADQITGLTDEISGSVTKQREETTEVAASIEEISSSIYETSRNAAVTASTAEKAKAFAENGGKVVLNTLEGMKQIALKVKQSADVVYTLGVSSKEIGAIVNVINDIADQTNLLALNAAIEAARAGEQGRGFAIVADEVRKLAERTSKATQQIETMIKKIQKDTDLAVSSMEESKMDVDRGIKLADQAGDSLQQIVSISQAVTDKVNEISNANNEQASVSEQISFKIDNIEKLSHHTSESMTLINSHVQDFKEITRQLKLLNDRFILSGEVHSREKFYRQIN